MGVITISKEISELVTTELMASVNRALYPGYAKISNNLEHLAESYLKTVTSVALFVFPAGVGLAMTADLFVPILLGPKWLELIPAIQLLSISAALVSIQTNGGYIHIALGNPWIPTVTLILSLSMLFPLLIWLTSHHGLLGAAAGQLATVCIMAPINYAILLRVLKLPLVKLVGALWRPAAATAAMAVMCVAVKSQLPPIDALGLQTVALASLVVVGALAYVMALFSLWRASGAPSGPEQIVFERLSSKVASRYWAAAARRNQE